MDERSNDSKYHISYQRKFQALKADTQSIFSEGDLIEPAVHVVSDAA